MTASRETTGGGLRQLVHHWLEESVASGGVGRTVNVCLIVLITFNVIAVALETVESLHQRYEIYFAWFEIFSVCIFSLEYLARLWACIEDKRYRDFKFPRLRYAFSIMALVDLVAILPFFLAVFFSADLRFLRVLRLLRVFKLTRYSSAMNVLLDVFYAEARALFASFFILFVLLVLAASGAYLAEQSAQPEKFGSIPAAMWWAVATLTTVGYGDVTPVTVGGKLFGSIVTVVGIGMAALPAGILASGLANHLQHQREQLSREFRKALEDGVIDSHEAAEIEKKRKSLGISQAVAEHIRHDYEYELQQRRNCSCPNCGHQFKPGITHQRL